MKQFDLDNLLGALKNAIEDGDIADDEVIDSVIFVVDELLRNKYSYLLLKQ